MGGCPLYARHTIDQIERGSKVGDVLFARFRADKDIGELIIHKLFGDALANPVKHGGEEDHVGEAHPDNQDGQDDAGPASPLERSQGKQERDF